MDPELLTQLQDTGIIQGPSPQDPRSFTDEDMLAHFGGYSMGDSTQAASPAPTAPDLTTNPSQPDAAPQAPLANMLTKGSAEVRGYSPAKHEQIARGAGARLDQNLAKIKDEAAAQGAQAGGAFTAAAGEGKAAALDEAGIQANAITAQGHYKSLMAKLQLDFAGHEARVTAEESAKASQSKANYVAALNDYRSSSVNPGQLWGNMNGGQKVGMLAAAFVQDFLGAKGIHTSAMATLNKAIEHNIDAQLTAIKTKGDVAQGFKQLWDMQRAESSSDAEGRARVRGFLLDSAKLAIESNMAQFDSQLATAKGRAAVAKIDEDLSKNLMDVFKLQDSNAAEMTRSAVTRYGDELRASVEYAKIAAEKEQRMAAQKAAQQADMMKGLIPDPTQSGGGQFKWKFRPGVDEVTQRDVLGKVEGHSNLVRDAEEYKSLVRQYDAIPDVVAKNRFANTQAAKMRELQVKIVLDDQLRRTGKAAIEQEREQISQRIPLNTWANRSNVETIVSGFEKHGIDDMNTALGTYATDLPTDDPRRQLRGSQGGFAPGERANAQNTYDNEGKGPDRQPVDLGTQALTRPDKSSKASDSLRTGAIDAVDKEGKSLGVQPTEEWRAFTKENPEATGYATYEDRGGKKAFTGDVAQNDAPAYAVGLMVMRHAAERGDPKAVKQLEDWAGLNSDPSQVDRMPDGKDPNDEESKRIRKFALYEYDLAKQAGVIK